MQLATSQIMFIHSVMLHTVVIYHLSPLVQSNMKL